jgi:hypothetical protein
MRFFGLLIALALFLGVLYALGVGLGGAWDGLWAQWNQLEGGTRPVVLLLATVIVLCTLLALVVLRQGLRKYSVQAVGKSAAYGAYLRWYIDADRLGFADIDRVELDHMRPDFLLWAGSQVMRQFNRLHDELNSDDVDSEAARTRARHVYIEIQRELGRRGGDSQRQI